MNNLSLLDILPSDVLPGRRPLMVEVPVPIETAPYLVTSSSSCLWIEQPFASGMVRAAVRKVAPDVLFRDTILAVSMKAAAEEWGSVFWCGAVGDAVTRMVEHDLGDVEILSSPTFDHTHVPDDVPVVPVTWLPDGFAVVIPSDRAFVGTVLDFGGGYVAAVVHNAARGLSIIAP